MVLLNRDFQPTPWMCTVDFTPVEKEITETDTPEEKPEPGPPSIKITSPSSGMTFTEEEEIILTVEAYDDAGNLISERYIYDRVKWTYDNGTPLACASLSGGDFRVNTKLSRATHTITVSIVYNKLEDTDTIELTVVPEEYTLLETLLKKEWSLYLRDDPSSNWVKFDEEGTFFFRNDGWKTSWILSGSSIIMEMWFDYKSGPDMIQHVKLTGSIIESPDGYYADATMQGEYEEWGEWDRDGTHKTGTWRAE
ncbi:Ig-like domain-containing protein [Chloroflexota bacterium]